MTRSLARLADIAYRRRGRMVLVWIVATVAIIELVDDRDHAAGRRPDRGAYRLLRPALGGVDHVQDPEQGRVQIDLADPLGEAARGVGPDLREQESDAGGGLVARDSPAIRLCHYRED
jgi:hypothetical protein